MCGMLYFAIRERGRKMKETEKKSIIELLDSMLRGNPVELCGVLASTNILVL